jgi:hypothetical protein
LKKLEERIKGINIQVVKLNSTRKDENLCFNGGLRSWKILMEQYSRSRSISRSMAQIHP